MEYIVAFLPNCRECKAIIKRMQTAEVPWIYIVVSTATLHAQGWSCLQDEAVYISVLLNNLQPKFKGGVPRVYRGPRPWVTCHRLTMRLRAQGRGLSSSSNRSPINFPGESIQPKNQVNAPLEKYPFFSVKPGTTASQTTADITSISAAGCANSPPLRHPYQTSFCWLPIS